MTPHPPTPITYRHRHAFKTAESLVQTGKFYEQQTKWLSLGTSGDEVQTRLTYTSFVGHSAHSGFTEDGNFWIEGTMVCEVESRDQWGRILAGTFTDKRFGFLFVDDGTYPTIFKWLRRR